ncbi:MAG: YIP1 family protein [Clostridia bacterium]|nr:YIP1 family protein [Clostridia bacterium]MBQ2316483.1 YIP1 family protein [Clostridia bacterium]
MIKNKILRVLCFVLIACLLTLSLGINVAATSYEEVPYRSYTYWEGYSQKKPTAIKEIYSPKTVIGSALNPEIDFLELQHICFDKAGLLYALDSFNAKITVLDGNYNIVRTISELQYKGETLSFAHAEGIFVNNEGKIFIADTANFRVIVLASDGTVENVFGKPDSYLIPEDLNFAPIKILQDAEGFLYVLCDGCYYGAMKFSPSYEFLGFFGSNTVGTSVLSAIASFFKELFATDAKRMNDVQRLPYTFLNFCIDDEGFIFTTTDNQRSSNTQVRRVGAKGTNILSHKFNFKITSGDSIRYGDPQGARNENNQNRPNEFSAVDTWGQFFYLLDRVTGRIFVYDFDCNMITAFSGGFGAGEQLGVFRTPTAIAVNPNGDIFVSDLEKKNITVFSLTEYGKAVMEAAKFNMSGEYDKAEDLWREVLRQDENNQLAYIGIGKAAMMKNDYATAMEYSRIGLDQETYSRAFGKVMTAKLKDNFVWVFLALVVIVSAIAWVLVVTTKKQVKLIKNPVYSTAAGAFFHPKDCFVRIKEKNLGSTVIATALLIIFFLTRTASDIYTGFMYVVPDNENYNVVYTFLGTIVLVLLWVIVNWGVCVLFEGKGRLKEIYITSCYSLIPLIIYSLLYIVLSYFMTPSSVSFLSLLGTASTVYFVIMILLAVMVVHEFDFVHAVLTSVCSVFGMLIVAFLIFMALTLCQDFISFVVSIIQESMLR